MKKPSSGESSPTESVAPFAIMSCNKPQRTILLIARCGCESTCWPEAAKRPTGSRSSHSAAIPSVTCTAPQPATITPGRVTYHRNKALGVLAGDNLKCGHSFSPHYQAKLRGLKPLFSQLEREKVNAWFWPRETGPMIEGSAEDVTQNLFSQQGAAQQQDHHPPNPHPTPHPLAARGSRPAGEVKPITHFWQVIF